MNERLYFTKKTSELAELAKSASRDRALLEAILAELQHRKTPSAAALRLEIEEALAGRKPGRGSHRAATSEAQGQSHTVRCARCCTDLNVLARPSTQRYSCVTCQAEFDVTLVGQIVSAVFLNATGDTSPEPEQVKTLEQAFRVLGLSAATPLDEVNRARLRLISEYHPDTVAARGPRLRQVAEEETKKINAAWDLIRQAHAK